MAEYLDREAFKKSVEERYCKPCKAEGKDHNGCWCRACWVDDMLDEVECFQPSDVAPVRLIDADNALKAFAVEYKKTKELIDSGETHLDNLAEGFTEAAHIIKYIATTVDAVPVVRCKDCLHYDMGVCLKIYSDGNVHSAAWQSRRPDDFCSYGERKDG